MDERSNISCEGTEVFELSSISYRYIIESITLSNNYRERARLAEVELALLGRGGFRYSLRSIKSTRA